MKKDRESSVPRPARGAWHSGRKSILEKGIHYTLHGGTYFPDFTDLEDCGSLGRWADLHPAFLKEHPPHAYVEMLFADKLVPYLRNFQAQTEARYQRMVAQMRQAEGVMEELKARDPMAWVGGMNEIAARPEGLSWRNG